MAEAPHDALRLRDPFGRVLDYLRVSLTEACNLRCTYCVPQGGFDCKTGPGKTLPLIPEELERVVRVAVGLGVRKVRLTGGEPLLRRDLLDIVRRLRSIEGLEELSLSTNALSLAPLAAPLRRAGLDRVNVSLDTLRPDRFRRITGRRGLSRVLAGIRAAVAAGFRRIKLNAVVLRGVNDDELGDLVDLAVSLGPEVRMRFIEFMPMCGATPWRKGYVPRSEMVERLADRLLPGVVPWGDPHEPAQYRTLRGGGEVGFISPVSEGFCDRCNRLRLTADGVLRACLASGGEVDLAGPLRKGASEAELTERFLACASLKPARGVYPEGTGSPAARAMIRIGG